MLLYVKGEGKEGLVSGTLINPHPARQKRKGTGCFKGPIGRKRTREDSEHSEGPRKKQRGVMGV